MKIHTDRLTSFDIYTKYKPTEVVHTNSFDDVCSGMNPCFYMRDGSRLKVSSSVAALIKDSGSVNWNPLFKPLRFPLHPLQHNALSFASTAFASIDARLHDTAIMQNPVIRKLRSIRSPEVKTFIWSPTEPASQTDASIDTRIRMVAPFESVTVDANNDEITLQRDYTITDLDEYLERSAQLMRETINAIETTFPRKKHIVLVGGKDSQLISLVPKLNNQNWYIFTGEPNEPLIREWVRLNKIDVADIFGHDGHNEESLSDFKRKIVCSDLYSSPIHVRYLPTLEKLVRDFDGECVFWGGSMPRRASLYDASQRKDNVAISNDVFWQTHFRDFPAWQGNLHQTYSNYLGCPFLSLSLPS